MKIKLECKDITYDLIEELKQKVDIEPNDISSWKSLVELLEIKIGGLEEQIKVLVERQEMLVETNNGLGEEIADLEKENKRLIEKITKAYNVLTKEDGLIDDIKFLMKTKKNQERFIRILVEVLGLDVDLENHRLITDLGSIPFYGENVEEDLKFIKEIIYES